MNNLSSKHCIPCEGGIPPMNAADVGQYLNKVPGWQVNNNYQNISREFKFKNFKEAIVFVNQVAEIAESEGHHPDIYISYNRVNLELQTHAIKGFSENDFILAAKINTLL